MMDEAEALLRAIGCAKVNLQVRIGNDGAIEFYRRIGFSEEDVLSFGKRLENDE
jgi:ribosomal protein S18 acetylase RimI-like enzyme